MLAYALRRLMTTIPVILVATFMVFWAASIVTDPRDNLAQCANCNQAAYDRLIDLYDLDEPIPVRYVNWLTDFVSGDMGVSTSQGETPVSEIFWQRLWNTALIAAPAFILLTIIGSAAGLYSALRQYSKGDYIVTAVSYFGLAMPTFFFGLLLQVIFAIWLPKWTGWKPFWANGMHTESFGQYLSSVTLPVLTLLLVLLASDSRFIRTSVLDIKNADYVRTARAKGLSEQQVIRRHIFRNALIPAVTLWSLNVAALMGGSLITETVFSWPGLGRLLIQAIFALDLDIVMAVTLMIAVLAVVMNLVADLLYGFLDPRVRYE